MCKRGRLDDNSAHSGNTAIKTVEKGLHDVSSFRLGQSLYTVLPLAPLFVSETGAAKTCYASRHSCVN